MSGTLRAGAGTLCSLSHSYIKGVLSCAWYALKYRPGPLSGVHQSWDDVHHKAILAIPSVHGDSGTLPALPFSLLQSLHFAPDSVLFWSASPWLSTHSPKLVKGEFVGKSCTCLLLIFGHICLSPCFCPRCFSMLFVQVLLHPGHGATAFWFGLALYLVHLQGFYCMVLCPPRVVLPFCPSFTAFFLVLLLPALSHIS